MTLFSMNEPLTPRSVVLKAGFQTCHPAPSRLLNGWYLPDALMAGSRSPGWSSNRDPSTATALPGDREAPPLPGADATGKTADLTEAGLFEDAGGASAAVSAPAYRYDFP